MPQAPCNSPWTHVAACRALAAPGLEELSGPLVSELHDAPDVAHIVPRLALILNASHLFDASWQLAAHIRLPRKQLQQLGRGLRLVTRAGPTLVAVLALLPWSPAQAAVPRQAAASLLTTFESATAAAASAARAPTFPSQKFRWMRRLTLWTA